MCLRLFQARDEVEFSKGFTELVLAKDCSTCAAVCDQLYPFVLSCTSKTFVCNYQSLLILEL
jgi:hypothetical protein